MASPGLVVLDYADIIADSTSDALKLKIKEVGLKLLCSVRHGMTLELAQQRQTCGPRAARVQAYGYDGLGILAIRGIPHFTELRERLLPLSWKLGQLPPETL